MNGAPRRIRHGLNRALRETRARLRHALGLLLRRLRRSGLATAPLDLRDLRSVLVIRINGRLGNTMFMTPLLARLHELLPAARIDVAVSYPNAAALLEGTPGLDRVILFPHKGGAGMAGRFLGALRTLRRAQYDLAIEPTQHSTSGRIVLQLARSRFKLGFDAPTQWAPLTHAVAPPTQVLHMAEEPLYLLARALGQPWPGEPARLSLPLTQLELAKGRAALEGALAQLPRKPGAAAPGVASTFGFFAHATGFKALPRHWWLDFWSALRELAPAAVPVEFLPGAGTTPTAPGFAALHLPSQRELTAAMAHCRVFISADGGPMHLAGSTGTPVIGLFNGHSVPALYGPLKATDRRIDVRGLSPSEVAQQAAELWHRAGAPAG